MEKFYVNFWKIVYTERKSRPFRKERLENVTTSEKCVNEISNWGFCALSTIETNGGNPIFVAKWTKEN